ncbi:hydrolase [Paenibacillaceae bacterium]|nr:hydrolase [Paenibacillaceae bacterium]
MGSRIMHLIIAHKIAEGLSIEDRTSFLIGNIAPDAVATKDESHFFKGEVQDHSRHVDYRGFIKANKEYVESPYIWGYFTHLIADDVWLKGFNLSWLKNRMDADHEVFHLYHNDFRILNGKLLEHYGNAQYLIRALNNNPTIIDLEEVNSNRVKEYIPHAIEDCMYDQKTVDEQLNVFTMMQIIGYIETSVNLGILNLKPLLK